MTSYNEFQKDVARLLDTALELEEPTTEPPGLGHPDTYIVPGDAIEGLDAEDIAFSLQGSFGMRRSLQNNPALDMSPVERLNYYIRRNPEIVSQSEKQVDRHRPTSDEERNKRALAWKTNEYLESLGFADRMREEEYEPNYPRDVNVGEIGGKAVVMVNAEAMEAPDTLFYFKLRPTGYLDMAKAVHELWAMHDPSNPDTPWQDREITPDDPDKDISPGKFSYLLPYVPLALSIGLA